MVEKIKETFQNFLDDIAVGWQTLYDEYYGDENDNDNVPLYIANDLCCSGLVYSFEAEATGTGSAAFMLYRIDLTIHNDVISSTVIPFGRCNFDNRWTALTPEQRDAIEQNTNTYIERGLSIHKAHEGHVKILFGATGDVVVEYGDPPIYHYNDVYRQLIKKNNEIIKNNRLRVNFNNITYTTDNDGYIMPSNMFSLYIEEDDFRCLKTYPVICTCNDSDWISYHIANSGSANSYTHNYTTAAGDPITVYYGDNYIIIDNHGNQTTYNDLKTGLDVAVNKINEDNDTNLKMPSYTDVKYGPPTLVQDIEGDMPLAYIGSAAGMVKYIKINDTGLASDDEISDAVSRFDITTIGKDLLRNFISYKCFAILDIDPNNTVTRQIKVDGHGLEDAGGNPLQGQYIGGVKPIDFTAGLVPPLYLDFRDYAPYTKIELYVPFCGWFTLPSWCIGREITGTLFTDLYNGTVKAVIYASQTVVAEVGGCCAYDVPFVADATGAKAGAVISSALSTAAATAATVAVPNIATGITAISSAANTICAANSNVTTLKGVLGDGSNLNGLLHVYLKITRPQSPTSTTEIPEKYKHDFGIPCYKQLRLSEGDGFTQINDANITGDMTDREKQMIIDGFRHGLIL